MLPYERQKHILELFQSGTIVSPEAVMKKFDVSIATARRDLKVLEELHQIKKVYGGAVLLGEEPQDAPLKDRMISHQDKKDAIGRACAAMIEDGDFVILDCGTTTRYVAMHMKNKKDVTVITNSVLVVNELINTDVSVIILGGQLRKGELSIVGPSAVSALEEYQVTKCFISASGLSLSFGMSDFLQDEIEVKKKSISRAAQVFILADSSKFNHTAPRFLCGLNTADAIITDAGLAPELVAEFQAAGCNLILA